MKRKALTDNPKAVEVRVIPAGVSGKRLLKPVIGNSKKAKRKLKRLRRLQNKLKHLSNHKLKFFLSAEWISLRFSILNHYGRKCMRCTTTEGIIQVDHILPKSKYPHLQLDFNNMQVLCDYCNKQKSNTDFTDYRDPKTVLAAPYPLKRIDAAKIKAYRTVVTKMHYAVPEAPRPFYKYGKKSVPTHEDRIQKQTQASLSSLTDQYKTTLRKTILRKCKT